MRDKPSSNSACLRMEKSAIGEIVVLGFASASSSVVIPVYFLSARTEINKNNTLFGRATGRIVSRHHKADNANAVTCTVSDPNAYMAGEVSTSLSRQRPNVFSGSCPGGHKPPSCRAPALTFCGLQSTRWEPNDSVNERRKNLICLLFLTSPMIPQVGRVSPVLVGFNQYCCRGGRFYATISCDYGH